MAEGHFPRGVVLRFFRSQLPREETRELVRHLVMGCPVCIRQAREAATQEGLAFSEEEMARLAPLPQTPQTSEPPLPPPPWQAGYPEERLLHERLRAAAQWSALESEPPERRLAAVRADRQYHTWGFYERLLDRSRDLARSDPGAAEPMARLALEVVDALDPQRYGHARLADLRVSALAALGDAQRLASDPDAARQSLELAWGFLEQGSGHPFGRAELLTLRASLLRGEGKLDEAFGAMEEALEIYRGSRVSRF